MYKNTALCYYLYMKYTSWEQYFNSISKCDYWLSLMSFLDNEYKNKIIYPKRDDIFNAFKLTPLDEVKVVIIGQDPYHQPNQAHGLAFSTLDNKLPPSLKNIYKEMENEFNTVIFNSGDLTYLARQGVLLLNTILTVEKSKPLSHDISEYKQFTSSILTLLNELQQPIVFLLWGNEAKKYSKFLNNKNHLVLSASHPSPLGANKGGWFGCNHFIKVNEFLQNNNSDSVEWVVNFI